MAPDLSEKLLGIDIDDANDQRRRDTDDQDEEEEELEQFIFFEVGDHRLALPVEDVRTLSEIPDEVTRVPRAPRAIEGLIDLRGEITAVIDPRVHFPSIESTDPGTSERLLVLDRPSDQQSAALRIDGVIGVERVPVSDIHDEASVEDRPLSGDALEHPLVIGLIEQEQEPGPNIEEVVSPNQPETDALHEAAGDVGSVGGGTTALSSTQSAFDNETADPMGETFELEPDEAEESEPADAEDEDATREVVIEATPLLDLEKLLLASGHRERDE